jgi:hypothetical protein
MSSRHTEQPSALRRTGLLPNVPWCQPRLPGRSTPGVTSGGCRKKLKGGHTPKKIALALMKKKLPNKYSLRFRKLTNKKIVRRSCNSIDKIPPHLFRIQSTHLFFYLVTNTF